MRSIDISNDLKWPLT